MRWAPQPDVMGQDARHHFRRADPRAFRQPSHTGLALMGDGAQHHAIARRNAPLAAEQVLHPDLLHDARRVVR